MGATEGLVEGVDDGGEVGVLEGLYVGEILGV